MITLGIPNFSFIKRRILSCLSNLAYNNICGTTDSECIFALFLDALPDPHADVDIEELVVAVEKTFSLLTTIYDASGLREGFSCNICVSDGVNIVSTRFRNDKKEPPSLYYSYGSGYCKKKGNFSCHRSLNASEIIIASAPLHTQIDVSRTPQIDSKCCEEALPNTKNGWRLIPRNNMIVVEGDTSNLGFVKEISLRPLSPSHCSTAVLCHVYGCTVS